MVAGGKCSAVYGAPLDVVKAARAGVPVAHQHTADCHQQRLRARVASAGRRRGRRAQSLRRVLWPGLRLLRFLTTVFQTKLSASAGEGMKAVLTICLAIAAAGRVIARDISVAQPPPYKQLRYDEDYSWLRDPARPR